MTAVLLDVRPASPRDGRSPWDRAHDFVAYLAGLPAEDWQEFLQRVHAVDAAAHTAAVHRVADLLTGHPEGEAFAALQHAAGAAARGAAALGGTHAGRVATHAAFALALRDALSAREFAALYGPFARPEPFAAARGPDAGPEGADRRIAVDALAEVAGPLGPA